ncbi:mandelate racemase/muconate lactonizing enzyme family protein [Xanthovirga aplysinae]|uniref:mandelate racemase/muconate lactonizing enzyme family protein n=1 Tax=Xanthovirga aplysinae TaxID=2529853 RepID=UPI0012BD32F6|nr:dipeptide epimerase [Xanthovirga aplysinae]MTI32829.1 dipeptide epimerase [Xanthovirga aplysinae]
MNFTPFHSLRITKIEIFKMNIPLKEPFVISLGTVRETQNTVIKIHTNNGFYGVGECSPYPFIVGEIQASQFEIAKMLAQLLIHKNPLEIESRHNEMDQAIWGNFTIKSAFDIALYDIMGKYCQLPIYALLGGKNDKSYCTNMTVSLQSPEKMAQKASEFQSAGFPFIKVKLGGNSHEDIARIQAIRKVVDNKIPLRVDANQGWEVQSAIAILRELTPYHIAYCEEPISKWNANALVQIRNKCDIPIMADESIGDHHDAFRLAQMGACDYFNIKLAKCGGLFKALKILEIGEAAGIKSQLGGMSESRLALTAGLHLAAARKSLFAYDLDSPLMLTEDPVIGGAIYHKNGQVTLCNEPGVGADLDPGFLSKLEKTIVE